MPYYNRRGEAITFADWSTRHIDDDYRQIGQDHVGPLYVSTVWIGIDAVSRSTGLLPVIFETMIFASDDCGYEDYQVRYSTEVAAVKGHRDAVETAMRWIAETVVSPPAGAAT